MEFREESESDAIRKEGVGGGDRLRMVCMQVRIACSSTVSMDAELRWRCLNVLLSIV